MDLSFVENGGDTEEVANRALEARGVYTSPNRRERIGATADEKFSLEVEALFESNDKV